MEETQHGRNIGFVYLGLCICEWVTVGFQNPRLSITRCKYVTIPQVLHAVHYGRVLKHNEDELVVLPPVKPVEFALLHEFAFVRENTVFVVSAL